MICHVFKCDKTFQQQQLTILLHVENIKQGYHAMNVPFACSTVHFCLYKHCLYLFNYKYYLNLSVYLFTIKILSDISTCTHMHVNKIHNNHYLHYIQVVLLYYLLTTTTWHTLNVYLCTIFFLYKCSDTQDI